ncbi:MAG: 30S ribosomal protein S10 [Patescibacteria group bacterium]|nr:30S ribosomal protein S10 [Patescibacteria group bacterium]
MATAKKTPVKKVSAKVKAAPATASAEAKPKRTKKVTAPVEVQRLRIKVRAYEHKVLDASVKQILDTALRYDAKVAGPIPLPTEIKKYTVNRSTFIYKDAREQFEMRIHKRLIDILDPSPKVIEALTNLSLPSGVTIDVKMA